MSLRLMVSIEEPDEDGFMWLEYKAIELEDSEVIKLFKYMEKLNSTHEQDKQEEGQEAFPTQNW